MKIINIPVGTSNFAEIRRKGSYFIDKTGLIVQLLKTQSTKATLITRPRRFGKTLCMSMLSEFFDIEKESRHFFAGLSVMENEELCRQWMNQYPTLSLTFRSVDGLDFSGAYAQLVSVIAELYKKHSYLTESERIHPLDQEQFHRIAAEKSDLKDIKNSLLKLTRLMELYYEKPVILLIDEYDVPLAKASEKGYYSEMLDVVKGIMQVIKDNDSLELAVITGCLKIAKESIFTGTNNFVSDTISDTQLNEYFGFTQDEVNRLLAGGYIVEPIEENLTYDVLEGSEENLWSLLNLTGYLTRVRLEEIPDLQLLPGQYALKIPNKEVLGIFKKSVKAWLMETTAQKDRKNRRAVVLEAKRTYDEDKLESDCDEALAQIQKKRYAEKAERDGYKNVGRLGIAFFQKKCLVKKCEKGRISAPKLR